MAKSTVPVVASFMTESPHSIGRSQTLTKAHEIMRANRIRHLPVLDGGKLVGMVSQRDLHLIESLSDVQADTVQVEEAMVQLPYAVPPDAPLDEVVQEMSERRYGSAVVMEHGKIVGVFTTTDAMRVFAQMLRDGAVVKAPKTKAPARGD